MNPRVCMVSITAAAALAAGCESKQPAGDGPNDFCSASLTSCASTNCCASGGDECIPEGLDNVCRPRTSYPRLGPSCNGTPTSDLPGVVLRLRNDERCGFTAAEVAAGIQINYELQVAEDMHGVHPDYSPESIGHCTTPEASGFIVGFVIEGMGQRYCRCDIGGCGQQTFTTAPLAGRYPGAVAWDGRNWSGPSDTGNPEGEPFPPGTYTFTVRTVGTWDGLASPAADGGTGASTTRIPFTIVATRSITIEH
jgi:hypothetical protein